jgi:hypothetical protein
MEIVALVDWRDGGVIFFEPRTRIEVGKVYPFGGARRARGVDVLGNRAMITTEEGRRELWSVDGFAYIRDLD